MRLRMTLPVLAAAMVILAGPAHASTAGKGFLVHNGAMVRTVVVPSSLPNGGVDPLYSVTNGVSGQLGIAGVAPGDGPYHGGAWAVYEVTFDPGVTAYLLTSDEAVRAAQSAGDVTVTRAPTADFRCPLLP